MPTRPFLAAVAAALLAAALAPSAAGALAFAAPVPSAVDAGGTVAASLAVAAGPAYDGGDTVVLDRDGSGLAGPLDLVLSGRGFGRTVQAGSPEDGAPLEAGALGSFAFHDADQDGALDVGEVAYYCPCGRAAAAGDVRLVPSGNLGAGTQVGAGDPDDGLPLRPASRSPHFADLDADGAFGAGDAVYLSQGEAVAPGDVRLTPAFGRAAGSQARAGDADHFLPLEPLGFSDAFLETDPAIHCLSAEASDPALQASVDPPCGQGAFTATVTLHAGEGAAVGGHVVVVREAGGSDVLATLEWPVEVLGAAPAGGSVGQDGFDWLWWLKSLDELPPAVPIALAILPALLVVRRVVRRRRKPKDRAAAGGRRGSPPPPGGPALPGGGTGLPLPAAAPAAVSAGPAATAALPAAAAGAAGAAAGPAGLGAAAALAAGAVAGAASTGAAVARSGGRSLQRRARSARDEADRGKDEKKEGERKKKEKEEDEQDCLVVHALQREGPPAGEEAEVWMRGRFWPSPPPEATDEEAGRLADEGQAVRDAWGQVVRASGYPGRTYGNDWGKADARSPSDLPLLRRRTVGDGLLLLELQGGASNEPSELAAEATFTARLRKVLGADGSCVHAFEAVAGAAVAALLRVEGLRGRLEARLELDVEVEASVDSGPASALTNALVLRLSLAPPPTVLEGDGRTAVLTLAEMAPHAGLRPSGELPEGLSEQARAALEGLAGPGGAAVHAVADEGAGRFHDAAEVQVAVRHARIAVRLEGTARSVRLALAVARVEEDLSDSGCEVLVPYTPAMEKAGDAVARAQEIEAHVRAIVPQLPPVVARAVAAATRVAETGARAANASGAGRLGAWAWVAVFAGVALLAALGWAALAEEPVAWMGAIVAGAVAAAALAKLAFRRRAAPA